MPPLNEWNTLLAVQAGAAATLTGLVFVAVSINLAKIVAYPGLPSRAAESILQFLQVFFVCAAVLVPGQKMMMVGIEVLAIAVFSWAMQVIAHVRYARARSGHPRLWLIIRVIQTQLASVPLVVGAGYLFSGWPVGLYWFVPGFVFSIVAGVANAWVLLVEVVR